MCVKFNQKHILSRRGTVPAGNGGISTARLVRFPGRAHGYFWFSEEFYNQKFLNDRVAKTESRRPGREDALRAFFLTFFIEFICLKRGYHKGCNPKKKLRGKYLEKRKLQWKYTEHETLCMYLALVLS